MHFERIGHGPALILLPGLACDARLWAPLAEKLADRFTLVIPETWSCTTLSDAAQGVSDIMSELGSAPAGVAGLSMGGYVTFELLRRWPQKIRAAAILDSTPYADSPDRVDARQQVLRLIEDGRFEQVLSAFTASVLAPQNRAGGPKCDLLLAMARDLGAQGYARSVRAILERDSYEDVLRSVRVPLLFVAGEYDSLSPPDLAREVASQVPGAHVEVIPQAGHMTPLEAPDRVAELLGAFFGKIFQHGS